MFFCLLETRRGPDAVIRSKIMGSFPALAFKFQKKHPPYLNDIFHLNIAIFLAD